MRKRTYVLTHLKATVHLYTSQLIYKVDQLNGFCKIGILVMMMMMMNVSVKWFTDKRDVSPISSWEYC